MAASGPVAPGSRRIPDFDGISWTSVQKLERRNHQIFRRFQDVPFRFAVMRARLRLEWRDLD